MWVSLAALYLMTAGQLDRRERLRLRIGKCCVTCVAHVHSGDSEKRSVPLSSFLWGKVNLHPASSDAVRTSRTPRRCRFSEGALPMFPPPTPRTALSLASLRRRWPYEPRKRKQGRRKKKSESSHVQAFPPLISRGLAACAGSGLGTWPADGRSGASGGSAWQGAE